MFGICQVVWHPTSTSIVLAVLPRAEFVRGLLSEQDALQERLNEIEDTLQLFRSQPAILGCLLNGISQSSCRKPLGED